MKAVGQGAGGSVQRLLKGICWARSRFVHYGGWSMARSYCWSGLNQTARVGWPESVLFDGTAAALAGMIGRRPCDRPPAGSFSLSLCRCKRWCS